MALAGKKLICLQFDFTEKFQFIILFTFFRLTNGASSSGGDGNTAMMWMMGATLNTTSSAAAKEMDMVLKSEIATHAAYETRPSYHGCPLPGKKQVCFHGKTIFE